MTLYKTIGYIRIKINCLRLRRCRYKYKPIPGTNYTPGEGKYSNNVVSGKVYHNHTQPIIGDNPWLMTGLQNIEDRWSAQVCKFLNYMSLKGYFKWSYNNSEATFERNL